MGLYEIMLEAYNEKLVEGKINLAGNQVRVKGHPSSNVIKKITTSYKKGVSYAAKKLYPIYKREWGKESLQNFIRSMKPVDISIRADGYEIYFNTDKFEDHSIVVRFDKNGNPVDAYI